MRSTTNKLTKLTTRRQQTCLEALESRQLRSATLNAGFLTVNGTEAADNI
jgi:hypothetical protein